MWMCPESVIVPRLRESEGTLNSLSSVCLYVRHKNFDLGHNFCTITDRALILVCSLLQDLSGATMSWPWRLALTYFKVKFVAERGTTILWMCLITFHHTSGAPRREEGGQGREVRGREGERPTPCPPPHVSIRAIKNLNLNLNYITTER